MGWRKLVTAKDSERGAALLAAMFIVALMAAAGAAATEEIRYAVRRASNIDARTQAYWYALGAEQLAGARLAAAEEAGQRAVLENAAAEGQTLGFPIAGGAITATLGEAQNCFNLNSVVQREGDALIVREAAAAEFAALLNAAGIRGGRPRVLTAALIDWIDTDGRPRAGGGEDAQYLAGPAPHLAANAPMAEIEELRAVSGFDEATFAAVRPLVCALPTTERVALNVNTLRRDQAALLAAAVGEELTLEEAEDVIAARPAAGYAEIEAFLAHPRLAEIALAEDQRARLGLVTRRFALATDVTYRGAEFRLESLIESAPGQEARVTARRFGAAE